MNPALASLLPSSPPIYSATASQPLEKLLRESDKGQELYADSAYIGEPIETLLQKNEISLLKTKTSGGNAVKLAININYYSYLLKF